MYYGVDVTVTIFMYVCVWYACDGESMGLPVCVCVCVYTVEGLNKMEQTNNEWKVGKQRDNYHKERQDANSELASCHSKNRTDLVCQCPCANTIEERMEYPLDRIGISGQRWHKPKP